MRTRIERALICLVTLVAGCGGSKALPWDFSASECAGHAQCERGEACVVGVCERGRLDQPMDVEEITGPLWFADEAGTCSFDEECGPWVCDEGACVSPRTAGITLPARSQFAMWDTSCTDGGDCGSWFCIDGWCTDPDRVSPQATPIPDRANVGTGVSCTGDSDCDEGDCVAPGYCHVGRSDEPMLFVDIHVRGLTRYDDRSCNYDTDCGPWVCDAGWCRAGELAGRATQTRGAFEYYDGSCNADADCGAWTCARGWCTEGDADAFRGVEGASSQAGEARAAGTDDDDWIGANDAWELGALDGDVQGLWGSNTGDAFVLGGSGAGLWAEECLGTSDCPPDQVCVSPGTCQAGLMDEPFDLAGIGSQIDAYHGGLDCQIEADCGPWTCQNGQCVVPDWADRTPLRRDVEYYDFSCSSTADCGDFECTGGWCRP